MEGLGEVWLVRDGEVLAAAEVARTRRERARGLLGRDGFTGALVFRKCRQVHTFGMRFDTLRRRRMSPIVWRSAFVIEADGGAFERWGLRVGDRVEVKE